MALPETHHLNAMELYQSIRKYYFWIGINPPKLNQIYLYDLIKIFIFSSLTIAFVLVTGFFLFEAKSIVEYGLSFYISSSVLFVLLNLALTYFEMPNTLKLIERFEHFIELSKWAINLKFTWSYIISTKKFVFSQMKTNSSSWNISIGASNAISRCLYNELNVKIEHTSHLIYFGIVVLTFIGCMIPALLITMVNYFIFDLEEASFYLPFPALYA